MTQESPLEIATRHLRKEMQRQFQAELRAFADYNAHRIDGIEVVKMDDLLAFLEHVA